MTSRGGVVVTGSSTGIGKACALHLDKLGFQVFACVLPGEDTALLQTEASDRLVVIELDVTDEGMIASAFQTVSSAVGKSGLVGLVNNAGVGRGAAGGPLEFVPLTNVRRQIEINVIGQVAVTQAFLPLLRQGHGRIVMMGSVAGQLICPFAGPYSASKAALHALGAALRMELRPWKISVSIVMPGIITTPIWEKSHNDLDKIVQGFSVEERNLYRKPLAVLYRSIKHGNNKGDPPEVVAFAVEHALTAERPKKRYIVGQHSRLFWLLMLMAVHDHLPYRFLARKIGFSKKIFSSARANPDKQAIT